MVVSMQALSGAGYPGVASLDAVANVIPFIRGEEEKVEAEARKILGSLNGDRITDAPIAISASCNRVPVVDGHTISASFRIVGAPSSSQVVRALEAFQTDIDGLQLPSAPARFLQVHNEEDRPQPRRDVEEDGGMRIHVGRIRPCSLLGTKLTVLGHNTERGAAGASVLNAELAVARGIVT